MGFEYFDMASYQKNGFLSEKDYNTFSRKLVNAINPIRVNTIRKNMEFVPMNYMDYTKEPFEEFLEDGEFSIPLEINSVSVPLLVSFNSNFFPNFIEDYAFLSSRLEAPFYSDEVFVESIEGTPLKQVLNSNYNSLAIAAYDIEVFVKDAFKRSNLWKISEDISVLVEFYVPGKISCNWDITIKLIISLYDN